MRVTILLLAKGADVKTSNNYGETALTGAVSYCALPVVKLLVSAVLRIINVKDTNGKTALDLAYDHTFEDITEEYES